MIKYMFILNTDNVDNYVPKMIFLYNSEQSSEF